MKIKRDTRRYSYGVWVKASEIDACPGCEVDGDYTRVFSVDRWLVDEVMKARRIRRDIDAVEFIFNQHHRSR